MVYSGKMHNRAYMDVSRDPVFVEYTSGEVEKTVK